jgi:hypothetical protein
MPPLVSNLGYVKTVHIRTFYFLQIHSDIIFRSILKAHEWSHSVMVSGCNAYANACSNACTNTDILMISTRPLQETLSIFNML